MTARMLATLALALGLTVYAGCSGTGDKGDTDVDTDAGDDDDDDAPTAETGDQGPDYFVPAVVSPDAFFGFDADTNTLVDVTTPYGALPPSIVLSVGNAEWQANGLDPNLSDLYCVVVMSLTDPTFAPWAQTAGLYYGVTYDGSTPPTTTCTISEGFDVDPGWTEGYGDGALAGVFSGPWGVGFGPITQPAADLLADYTYAQIPEGSFFGASFDDPLLGYIVADNGAIASELDASFALTGNILPGAGVTPGNGLVTAFYETVTLYSVTFTAQ